MEPLTHFLTGACISRAAGLNRKTLLATTTCVLAAEAADLDVLWLFKSPIDSFAHHRGITHSFVGAPFVAAFVVGFMYLVWLWKRRRRPEPAGAAKGPALPKTPRWGLLYGYALIAALSHILLDFTNNYGVRPFEPFSYRWYSWDIVFIFEPLLYVFFLAGLAMPALFAMINEEIGARRKGPRGQGGAVVALVLMVALWGLRDYQHRRAVAALVPAREEVDRQGGEGDGDQRERRPLREEVEDDGYVYHDGEDRGDRPEEDAEDGAGDQQRIQAAGTRLLGGRTLIVVHAGSLRRAPRG